MKIEVKQTGDVTVLVIGEQRIDVSNADKLKKQLSELLDDNSNFVIDVAPVRFMDTTGIGALLWCWMRVNASDGALRLSSISEPVRELLDLVKISDVLEIRSNQDDAVQDLERGLEPVPKRRRSRAPKRRKPGRSGKR